MLHRAGDVAIAASENRPAEAYGQGDRAKRLLDFLYIIR
jgi:hypothetical protein